MTLRSPITSAYLQRENALKLNETVEINLAKRSGVLRDRAGDSEAIAPPYSAAVETLVSHLPGKEKVACCRT